MSQRPHADVSPNRDDEIDLEKEKVIHTEQVHNGNMTAEEAAQAITMGDSPEGAEIVAEIPKSSRTPRTKKDKQAMVPVRVSP